MSEQPITGMNYDDFMSLVDGYIERSTQGDDEMPTSVFFGLLSERMAERVTETIELEIEIVDNQPVLQLPTGAVQVSNNEILLGDRRIIVKLKGDDTTYPLAH